MNKYSYENKKVYIGLDVHKKTYAYTVRCEGVTVKRGTMPADPRALVTFLNKYFSGAEINTAYEAGCCGFVLHRFLCKNGIQNIVVNPASIETAARERVKTDKRDSMKIAIQLEARRLKGIHIPSIEQEQRREMSRFREVLVKKKSVTSNQIKSLILRHGIKTSEGIVSKKWLQGLKELELPNEIRFVLDGYIEEWFHIHGQIQKVEEKLKIQAQEAGMTHKIIESLPGIGLITARVLSNELGDMQQFHNVRELYSFSGLTPREYSSGERIRLGHISRQGRALLRKTLVQSAWVAIRSDQELRHLYEQLSKRIGGRKAIVAIARKLIGRVRACLKKATPYERYQVNKEGELIQA
jgi:transposase